MDCRPLGFLISLPFAIVAVVLSFVGVVIYVLASALSCLCPCCSCCAICFAGLANSALRLMKLPLDIILWFLEFIPC